MRFLFVFLLALTLCGCGAGEETPVSVKVRVERIFSTNRIRVQWILPEPARALIFHRSGAGRERQWHTRTQGTSFVKKGGFDVLESRRPTREFIVEIDERFVETAGNYPLMIPFSDKGVVLFTDHLRVSWMNCLFECPDDQVAKTVSVLRSHEATFVSAPGEWVVASGRAVRGSISLPASTSGAVVYFGPRAPSRGKGFMYVVDKDLPEWTLQELLNTFPRIIHLYTQRLGIRLNTEPVVFLPYVAGSRRMQASFSGSVLGSEVVLGLFGDRWKNPDTEARVDFSRLMAHESFHLWNASQFRSIASAGGEWLHEGSADAFAALALSELGLIDRLTYLDMHKEALNRCALGLSSVSVTESPPPWAFRISYDCGSVMQILLHRALRDQSEDLWGFWVSLFEKASRNAGYYTHDDFFAQARASIGTGVRSSLFDKLQQLGAAKFRESFDNPRVLEGFFSGIYDAAGIGLVLNERSWPPWYSRLVVESALTMTIDGDCQGAMSKGYWMAKGTGARLIGNPGCRSIKGEFEIEGVGDYLLWLDGVRVYDHIHQMCRRGPRLSVMSPDGRSKSMVCPRLPARPRFLEPRGADRL